MSKYGRLKRKIMATNDMFDQALNIFSELFKSTANEDKDKLFVNMDNLNCQYMMGYGIWSGRPWLMVDHVLVLANTGKHWILVLLDLK